MSNQPTIEVDAATTAASERDTTTELAAEPSAERLVEETLVEEVSIDGMCGVY